MQLDIDIRDRLVVIFGSLAAAHRGDQDDTRWPVLGLRPLSMARFLRLRTASGRALRHPPRR